MYIRVKCPTCDEEHYHELKMLERKTYCGHTATSEIVEVNVSDTCTAHELARSVLQELAGHVYNGMTKTELCQILHNDFGILDQYCCDIVQQLKVELDMYSPDHQHLFFVNA